MTSFDDSVVGGENSIGQVVLAQKLPDIADLVGLRRVGRQSPQVMLSGTHSRPPVLCQPAPSSVTTPLARGCDAATDLGQMQVHRFGIGIGQHEGRADAARRTNGAKQIGRVVALIARRARPRLLSSHAQELPGGRVRRRPGPQQTPTCRRPFDGGFSYTPGASPDGTCGKAREPLLLESASTVGAGYRHGTPNRLPT